MSASKRSSFVLKAAALVLAVAWSVAFSSPHASDKVADANSIPARCCARTSVSDRCNAGSGCTSSTYSQIATLSNRTDSRPFSSETLSTGTLPITRWSTSRILTSTRGCAGNYFINNCWSSTCMTAATMAAASPCSTATTGSVPNGLRALRTWVALTSRLSSSEARARQ